MTYSGGSPKETLHGFVRLVTHHDETSGFFVAKVDVGGKEKTVVGAAAVITPGERIKAVGTWKTSLWGPQFKANEVHLSKPTELAHIEKYLCSSVPGVGPSFAKKLVDALGESVFDTIENHPEQLRGIPGVGPKRVQSLIDAYNENKASRTTLTYLYQIGLSPNRAQKILLKLGSGAVAKIKENPYVLCNIWGIGFSTADSSAQKQGIALDSPFRVRAGLVHILGEAESDGSCGLPITQIQEKTSILLGLSYDLIDKGVLAALDAQELVQSSTGGEECLFLPSMFFKEKQIAKKLVWQAAQPTVDLGIDLDYAILEVEMDMGIILENSQRAAVKMALTNQVCVITGGPGTGKTTLTKVILTVLSNADFDIALAAPTGKAAKRASEATGFEGKTNHRQLEFSSGEFKRNENNPLEALVLCEDEMSMMDVPVMDAMMKAVNPRMRLIFIGDVDQLRSVGAGQVLADMLDSQALPTVRLTEVFRQAKASHIVKNAHLVNSGRMPDTSGQTQGRDFVFLTQDPLENTDEAKADCRQKILQDTLRICRDLYKLGYDPIRDVQVLCPMNPGALGVIKLNEELQKILNPSPAVVLELGGRKWCVGDKVIQLKNAYNRGVKGVFNGDIGFIDDINLSQKTVIIAYDEEKVVYQFSDLDELRLAYALTVHKCQGSQFPVVVMLLDTSHFKMLKRNTVYTGMTRAMKLMIIIGRTKAMQIAVADSSIEKRYSKLKDWLIFFHAAQ